MKTQVKNYFKALFAFTFISLLTFTSCSEDDEYSQVSPRMSKELEPSASFYDYTKEKEKEKSSFPEMSIQSADLSERKIEELKYLFKKIDPSLYQLEVHRKGEITDKLGSAAIRDLRQVDAYYHPEFGNAQADEIVTTVSDIIKTVWTTKLFESGEYHDVVERINNILNESVVQKDIRLSQAKMTEREFEALQEAVSSIDPELYTIEIHNEGKVVDQWGSAAIRDLRQVEAYYHPEFGGAIAANEIVTTVSNYIKTVWTSKLLESGLYSEQVARVEEILNHSAQM